VQKELLKGQLGLHSLATQYCQELGITLDIQLDSITATVNNESFEWTSTTIAKQLINKHYKELCLNAWKAKHNQGKLKTEIDVYKGSWSWLVTWTTVPTVVQNKFFELMANLTPTLSYLNMIQKSNADNHCRMCHKTGEFTSHILSGCEVLLHTKYKFRHDQVLKRVLAFLLHRHNLENFRKVIERYYEPKPKYSNHHGFEIYWDVALTSEVPENRPDISVLDHNKKSILLIEQSCPWDANIEKWTLEKERKYLPLVQTLRSQYPNYSITTLPLVIGALGGVADSTLSNLSKITNNKKQAKDLLCQMQQMALFGTVNIIQQWERQVA